MHEDGYIDAAKLKAALDSLPANLVAYEGLPQGSHFADHLARDAKALAKTDVFIGDSYTVHATIHPELQRAAEAALQEGLSRYERNAGRVDFQGPETNLAAAVAAATVSEPAAANEPPWQRALQNARLPLYDVHWAAAIVIEEASSKNGRTVRVGLADGRVLPLSLGRVTPSKLKAHDVVLIRLIEGKGKAARAELRVRPVVQGSVIVLENQSGRILAMTGGFSYPISQLNRVTHSQRQPGSSLKPLVYLAALQRGLQPNTRCVTTPSPTRRSGAQKNPDRRISGLPRITTAATVAFLRSGRRLKRQRICPPPDCWTESKHRRRKASITSASSPSI
jgi:membrane carboxypeptidase/penicillin-binding protein